MNKVVSFDLATTGVSIENDQIVGASFASIGDNGEINIDKYILKTDKESEDGAIRAHGITREDQELNGLPYKETVIEIAKRVSEAGLVLTANGTFDLSILQNSLDKMGEDDYDGWVDLSLVKMVDIVVLDKYLDKYRRGSRSVENIAKAYGIKVSAVPNDYTRDSILSLVIYYHALMNKVLEYTTVEELPQFCEKLYHDQRTELFEFLSKNGSKPKVSIGYPITTGGLKVD